MTKVNANATVQQNKESAAEDKQGQLTKAERLAKAKAAAERAKALREQRKQAVGNEESAKIKQQAGETSASSLASASTLSEEKNTSHETSQGEEDKSNLSSQDPGKEKLAEKLAQARKLRDAARANASKRAANAPTSDQDVKSKTVEGKDTKRPQAKLVSSLDDLETIEGVKEQVYTKAKQPSLWEIFIKGIWKDNPGLCQLLGMCPLLAVTTSAANALGLGIATIVVMVLSSMVISLLRKFIMSEVRIPLYVVIIATLVTVVRMEVEAYFPSLYQQLGIYLSLIVTNCIIMARAEAFAGKNNLIRSTVDAIACSIGFTIVLFALGCVREIIGNGTLFMGAADVLGAWAAGLETQVISAEKTLLTAILPPGGFFILALFIAGKNFLDGIAKRRAERKLAIKMLSI